MRVVLPTVFSCSLVCVKNMSYSKLRTFWACLQDRVPQNTGFWQNALNFFAIFALKNFFGCNVHLLLGNMSGTNPAPGCNTFSPRGGVESHIIPIIRDSTRKSLLKCSLKRPKRAYFKTMPGKPRFWILSVIMSRRAKKSWQCSYWQELSSKFAWQTYGRM